MTTFEQIYLTWQSRREFVRHKVMRDTKFYAYVIGINDVEFFKWVIKNSDCFSRFHELLYNSLHQAPYLRGMNLLFGEGGVTHNASLTPIACCNLELIKKHADFKELADYACHPQMAALHDILEIIKSE